MIYKSERDLQIKLTTLDFQLDNSRSVSFIRRELPIAGCIPDLLNVCFFQTPSIKFPHRWTYKHSYVTWLLKIHKTLQAEKIASLCYESIDRLSSTLKDLVNYQIIIEENNYLTLSSTILAIDAEVIAIEAKLQKWRDALFQAKHYKCFADKVIVAMDEEGIPRNSKVISLFIEEGIGLCSIGQNSLEWITYPVAHGLASGHEREYIITSAIVPSRQELWSRRYLKKASNQA